MKQKNKEVFFGMLLGNLDASLLGNMLESKGFIQAGEGAKGLERRGTIRAVERAKVVSRRQRQKFIVALSFD